MFKKSALLIVSVFVAFGFASAARANHVVYVLVDAAANRAYIPEGTVLPPGLQIRARSVGAVDPAALPEIDRSFRRSFAKAMGVKHGELPAAPLVFEYAPAARFAAMQKQYETKHPSASGGLHAAPLSDYCWDVYASQENTGIYGTYTDGITLTFCANYNTVVGYAYPWSFTVTGDFSDKDSRIDPAVGIYDLNNNFNCYDAYQYSGDLGQCTASNTTVWTNSGCTNHVHGWGLLYVIEYTNDPYHDNYLGFELDIDICTTFY
jgi:hypothetical protein